MVCGVSKRSDSTSAFGRFGRAMLLVCVVSSSIVSVVGIASYAAYQRANGTGLSDCFGADCEPGRNGQPEPTYVGGPCTKGVCNYLLLGNDSRAGLSPDQLRQFGTDAQAGSGLNADVIMLVHTDPKLKKAIVLSFPRDLWVNIPGMGEGRINSAFAGGATLVAETIGKLTGLHVNHFLYVNLKGFQGVVDALGGVDMCVPADNVNTSDGRITDVYTGLDIRPGCQRLDSFQALAYVRARHLPCDFIPDFGRIQRQQAFLRDVLNRLLQPSELVRAPALVQPVISNLTRDKALNIADLAYLVGQLRGISTGAVEFRAVPSVPAWEGSKSVLHIDPVAYQIFKNIRMGKPLGNLGENLLLLPKSPANIDVAVIAKQDSNALALEVEDVLSKGGFDITPGLIDADTLKIQRDGDVIGYQPGHESEARVVQSYFPGLQIQEINYLRWTVGIFVGEPHTLSSGSASPSVAASPATTPTLGPGAGSPTGPNCVKPD